MPEVSRFFGIVIKMFFSDHAPPHFHAYYQNYSATFSIKTGKKLKGSFPKTQETFITAWALLRKEALLKNWNSVTDGMNPNKIDPLR